MLSRPRNNFTAQNHYDNLYDLHKIYGEYVYETRNLVRHASSTLDEMDDHLEAELGEENMNTITRAETFYRKLGSQSDVELPLVHAHSPWMSFQSI